ncbi:MAG: glycosyltransferase [Gammaproteobacteria bacterium]
MTHDRSSTRVVLDLRNSYHSLRQVSNEYLAVLEPPNFRRISVLLLDKGRTAADKLTPDIPAERVEFLDFNNRQPFWRWRAAWRLRALCRQENVSLVIAHRFKSHHVMGLLHLLYPRAGLVAVVHGLNHLASPWRRMISQSLLRNATWVGVSDAVTHDIRTALKLPPSATESGQGRLVKLPNTLDVVAIKTQLLSRDQARQQLGLDNDEFIIGHVGRLADSKDQPSWLRAFTIARQQIPDARLVIVGDGRQRDSLHALSSELGIADNVVFAGYQPNAWRLMPAFDEFALTSVQEAFGMVLVEAMMAGVPIVATDVGGIGEVMGESFPLCKVGDVEGIAAELVRIAQLDAKARQQWIGTFRQRAESEFSRAGMGRRLKALLDRVDRG